MPEPWLRAPRASDGRPQTPMNTDQTRDTDRFQLGRDANPQSIRRAALNFNKFLSDKSPNEAVEEPRCSSEGIFHMATRAQHLESETLQNGFI